jgi:hypothetical protein
VLSDTIIITIPTSQSSAIAETFELLIQPFIESLSLRMLLRGVISYGTYYISERLVIGEALDDAAYHHNKIDWIGIALSPSLSGKRGINTLVGRSFTYYPSIPHKDRPYGGLVLNWPDFDADRVCYSILQSESKNGKDPKKYENTFVFYKRIVDDNK